MVNSIVSIMEYNRGCATATTTAESVPVDFQRPQQLLFGQFVITKVVGQHQGVGSTSRGMGGVDGDGFVEILGGSFVFVFGR